MRVRHLLLTAAALAACSGDRTPVLSHPALSAKAEAPLRAEDPPPEPPAVAGDRTIPMEEDRSKVEGLLFRAKAIEAEPAPAAVPVDAEALPEGDVKALLARLPPVAAKAGDTKDFALPEATRSPPEPGETVETPFPPKESAAPPPKIGAAPPLEILRVQPSGPVKKIGHLSITFSQPMVEVTTDDQLMKKDVPVSLSPPLEGRWRWAGTKTLLFEVEPRFPMATDYTLTVPAGVRSAVGGRLQEPSEHAFSTPPPSIVRFHPTGQGHGLSPLMFVELDQRVDPEVVLKTMSLDAGGRQGKLRLAEKNRIEADRTVKALLSRAPEGTAFAFQTAEPLPKDAWVEVVLGPGTPSAEGPKKTEAPQKRTFKTYGPFVFQSHGCRWGQECRPGMGMEIRFSNTIDRERFDRRFVTVRPRPAELEVEVAGSQIMIRGRTEPEARYTVSVSGKLTDVFGQALGRRKTVRFTFEKVRPQLLASGNRMVVLDPATLERPRFTVYSVSLSRLKVRLFRVEPKDWSAYLRWVEEREVDGEPAPPPGRKVLDRVVRVKEGKGGLAATSVSLAPGLKRKRGHVLLEVTPIPADLPKRRRRRPPKIRRWIQATDLGIDASVDHQDLYALVTRLSDGMPIEGAKLAIEPPEGGVTAATDAGGFAEMALPAKGGGGSSILVARRGSEIAFIPEHRWSNASTSWVKSTPKDGFRFFTFDDRQLYRPGETVHVKGWIRRITGGKKSDVAPIGSFTGPLTWTASGPRGNELAKGTAELSPLGGFDFSVKLDDDVNLGWARVRIRAEGLGSAQGVQHAHSFQIEEFRRPEFEVSATAKAGPHLVGQWAELSAEARYFSGGPLARAETRWQLSAHPAHYAPPNRSDYSFGIWTPWWGHYDFIDRFRRRRRQTVVGQTGAAGVHRLRVDLLGVDPPRAMTVNAQATVMDVNRQAWSASTSLLVHPASIYVGLKSKRAFVRLGQKIVVDAIRVDLEGKAAPGPVVMTAAPIHGGEDNETVSCRRAVERDGPVTCEFETQVGGPWRISAETEDERGRPNRSERVIWVAGGRSPPPSTGVEQERVELIPDRESYAAGDVAEVMVRSPFAPAEALVTFRRNGVLRAERLSLPEGTGVVKVPIEASYVPNVWVHVDAVGRSTRTKEDGTPDEDAPPRPAYAGGALSLSVPPVDRTLSVEATPVEPIVQPGEATRIELSVKDQEGAPVEGAEAAVVVVDEAVLALARYETPDPIPAFYPRRGDGTTDHHLRANVLLEVEPKLQAAAFSRRLEEAASGGSEKKARRAAPAPAPPPGGEIPVRKNFSALAVFAPLVTTDAGGRATVEVTMPDNLTRYRVMAVAVSGGKHFGAGESAVTAKLPLMVRPSPPRFLNYGDRFELPVVVQNQTNAEVPAAVVLRGTNAEATGAQGLLVRVPPQDRVEVRFGVKTVRPGTARFQLGIAARGFSDAAELSLPVWSPATTEAFATYGEVDHGAIRQPVGVPEGVEPGFGGLEITASSTQLSALTDAVLYLVRYPFGCSEQIASRVLGVAALKDVLAAFEVEGLPSPERIEAAVGRDVKRLQELQTSSGGWGFWRADEPAWPFNSVHVMHALVRAKEKGFDVPEGMVARGHRYLRSIRRHLPERYPEGAKRAIEAYGLYVRAMMGDLDVKRARAMVEEGGGVEALPLEIVGWLYPVLSDSNAKAELAAVRRALNNRVSETGATAHFVTSYEEGGYLILHSDRRADGLLLEGLIRDQPKSVLIPKLVRGLLAHRTKGRWTNTQENGWVLLALDRYFRTYEKVTPDFVARVWLGDRYAGDHTFHGRTTERQRIEVPMGYLMEAPGDVTVAKEGEGRLYYRIGLKYAPADLRLEPKSRGFEVERVYEPVDDPADVRRDEDGTWHIRAGARVRVRLTLTAPGRRYHVALVDPLPAGLEALNPALGMSDAPADRWWMARWYDHDNLRDERAEAFRSLLYAGVYGYAYVARATTVGTFVVPPAKAEEMYFPETYGRSGTDRVVVEPTLTGSPGTEAGGG